MAGYKETPRQKMIGMMYLVLTALLALNVSKDILNAFVIVNDSMEVTNANFDKKLADTYAQFGKKAATGGQEAEDYYKKAMEAKRLSDELVGYILQTRSEFIKLYDPEEKDFKADTVTLRYFEAKDDYEKGTNFFAGGGPGGELLKNAAGYKMMEKFKAYRQDMVNLVNPDHRDAMNNQIGLKTEGDFVDAEGIKKNWVDYNFYHTNFAADLVLLNKFINEVRNAEFDVVTRLSSYVGATDFKFNAIAARVIPKKVFLFKGEPFEAEVLVAAYDTAVAPDVRYITGTDKWPGGPGGIKVNGDKGLVVMDIPTGGMPYGEKKYAGVISLTNPLGVVEDYSFGGSFFVQESVAVISPDKVNVLYEDLENPVSVSVPGYPSEKVSVNVQGGGASFKQSTPGVYMIKPTNTTPVTISVTVKSDDNKAINFPAKQFKVRKVPPPTVIVADRFSGGAVTIDALKRARLTAVLQDFLFEGLEYDVIGYQLNANVNGERRKQDIKGDAIPADVRANIIEKLRTGATVQFENIQVRRKGSSKTEIVSGVYLNIL